MSKFLYLVEYMRTNYVINHRDGTKTLDFYASEGGKLFKKYVQESGLNIKDFDVKFVYPKVPEPKKLGNKGVVLSYKDPSVKEASEHIDQLKEDIVNGDYELVIPTGKLGLKLSGSGLSQINKLRGIPEAVNVVSPISGKERKVWLLPIYSMEYVMAQVNKMAFLKSDLDFIHRFDVNGEKEFIPTKIEYEYVDKMDRVREIFHTLKQNKPVVAWDTETNTLQPEMLGAKVLVFTFSWEHGQGVTIPLEKLETPFNREEQAEILELIRDFVADKTFYKVLHNAKYDIRFLMSAYGFKEFNNNLDTLIGYYLTVSQESNVSFRLSDLAFEFTDMGGYDSPLEKYKKEYISNYNKENKGKPINEVDGSNFNYDWIPIEILHPYASGDVDCTLRIFNQLKLKIDSRPEWQNLFYSWYPQLIVALARMESSGMMVDQDYLDVIAVEYDKECDRILGELRTMPSVQQLEDEYRMFYEKGLEEMSKPKSERDEELAKLRDKYKKKLTFNPSSSDDKARVIFDILEVKLPVEKAYVKEEAINKRYDIDDMDWRLYKADKFALQEVATGNYGEEAKVIADKLLEMSKVGTLRNNFTKKYRGFISNKDNKIHGTFSPTGTATSNWGLAIVI